MLALAVSSSRSRRGRAWPRRLEITSATLDGATSVSTPPGGVFNASEATGTDRWRATQYRSVTGSPLREHRQHDQHRHMDFNVTAPGNPATTTPGSRQPRTMTAVTRESATETLIDAVRVTEPGRNPNLPPRCGINVMLVLDESGSIASSNATESVRDATRAFLNALSGTGAAVSIIDFSSTAARPVPYTTVTSSAITTVFEPYLENGYNPSGWTNWEAAFQKVREANNATARRDLVVFVTDGDPTARNTASGDPVTGLVEGEAEALRRAAEQADLVKAQNSHVFALGVGAGRDQAHERAAVDGGFRVRPIPRHRVRQGRLHARRGFR